MGIADIEDGLPKISEQDVQQVFKLARHAALSSGEVWDLYFACANCRRLREEHVGEKCMYDHTNYTARRILVPA